MRNFLLNSLLVFGLPSTLAFTHPGIQFSSSQIDTIRTNALSGKAPWAATYANLQANRMSSSSYDVLGPHPIIAKSTNATIDLWTNNWQKDCIAAYLIALRYVITRDDAFAKKVAEIVDGYTNTLESASDNLLTGLAARQLVNAAEMVRYTRGSWPSSNAAFEKTQKWVSRVLVPALYPQAAPPAQPTVGGNQAFMGHAIGAQMAIFTNNATGYAAEMGILLDGPKACTGQLDSGIRALLQGETGQCSEAGRDQGHSADQVGWIEEMAQAASNQGDNRLFDYLSDDGETPLLALAFEYYFKYNLGGDVPFDQDWHPCCCGNTAYKVISEINRGDTYIFGESGYAYYSDKGLSLPFTKQALQAKRPLQITGNNRDWLAWQTLTWARGTL